MENKDTTKTQVSKSDAPKTKKVGKSMTITRIPVFAHEYVKEYKTQISAKRRKNYTIKEAYREFIVEAVNTNLKNVKTL